MFLVVLPILFLFLEQLSLCLIYLTKILFFHLVDLYKHQDAYSDKC
jgi:hypothetical protein